MAKNRETKKPKKVVVKTNTTTANTEVLEAKHENVRK